MDEVSRLDLSLSSGEGLVVSSPQRGNLPWGNSGRSPKALMGRFDRVCDHLTSIRFIVVQVLLDVCHHLF